jgi:hypothetical protein
MFAMLEEQGNGQLGWDAARAAAKLARGGATYVLQLPGYSGKILDQYSGKIGRMMQDGWNVHLVNSMEELLQFARQFSRQAYGTGQVGK